MSPIKSESVDRRFDRNLLNILNNWLKSFPKLIVLPSVFLCVGMFFSFFSLSLSRSLLSPIALVFLLCSLHTIIIIITVENSLLGWFLINSFKKSFGRGRAYSSTFLRSHHRFSHPTPHLSSIFFFPFFAEPSGQARPRVRGERTGAQAACEFFFFHGEFLCSRNMNIIIIIIITIFRGAPVNHSLLCKCT